MVLKIPIDSHILGCGLWADSTKQVAMSICTFEVRLLWSSRGNEEVDFYECVHNFGADIWNLNTEDTSYSFLQGMFGVQWWSDNIGVQIAEDVGFDQLFGMYEFKL